jgi:hypothetical protein
MARRYTGIFSAGSCTTVLGVTFLSNTKLFEKQGLPICRAIFVSANLQPVSTTDPRCGKNRTPFDQRLKFSTKVPEIIAGALKPPRCRSGVGIQWALGVEPILE